MNRIGILIGSFLVSAFGAGCGDDDRAAGDAGMEMTDGGGADTGPRGVDSGPEPDAGPTGDGNDSFATAEDLAFGTDGVMGTIDPAEDHDFYTFTGTAGQWVIIATEANPDDDPEMVDTVITLYDAEMTQIAENDDAIPRANTDSEIITRLPADGTYYIDVQEWTTWAGEPAEGDPTFEYTLTLGEVSPDAAAVTLDAEAGDDMASAQALSFSMDFGLLIGTFDDETDIDVFSLNIPGTERRSFSIDLMPSGTDGYGSTTPAGRVWVTSMDGTTIIARVDQSMGFEGITPSLPPGDYLVWVQHPGAAAGTNDFYVGKLFRGMENPLETATENGTLAAAQAITQTMVEGTTLRSGFILAELDSATDVDYFSFTVMDPEVVTVACGSASEGSGVQGLAVEVRDATDTAVGSDMEVPPDGVLIEDLAVAAAGTYYLRLEKTGQDAEVTGTFVRCGIHVQPPTAM